MYFSCHGVKDVDGKLYFATSDTDRNVLRASAISADFIKNEMFYSNSKRQVLLLDCCYSGAFVKGIISRSDKKVHDTELFNGRGRIVITASNSMQYAFDGDSIRKEGSVYSYFTDSMIDGLKTGNADMDHDGNITCNELYDYVYDRILNERPEQTPERTTIEGQGDIVIAQNPYHNKICGKDTDQDLNDLIQEAVECIKSGNYESTIEYLDQAIRINPSFAFAHNIKGSALFNLRQYQKALVSYEKALELRPKYIEAVSNKSLSFSCNG